MYKCILKYLFNKIAYLPLLVLCILLMTQVAYAQSPILQEIKSFAQTGNDTTLVLLEKIKQKINFETDYDLALEFYLIKLDYFKARLQNEHFPELFEACEFYYNQSNNQYLRLQYEKDKILKELNILKHRPDLLQYRKKALELNYPDLLADINKHLANNYHKEGNLDSASFYLNKAILTAQENALKYREVYLLRNKSWHTIDNEKAIEIIDKAIGISTREGYLIMEARLKNTKADRYYRQKSYYKALDIYEEIVIFFKENNLNNDVSSISRRIGLLYQRFGNDEAAIKHFHFAKELLIDTIHLYKIGYLTTDLAFSYAALDDIENGKKSIKESILIKEKIKDRYLDKSYNILGDLYLKEGELELALKQYEKSISSGEFHNRLFYRDDAYLGLQKIAIEKNELNSAEKYGDLALKFAEKNKDAETKYEIQLGIAKISALKGDYKKANQYYESSISMQDSIFDFNENFKLNNLVKDNERKSKEIEILKLEKENKEKEAVINQNKFQSTLYLLGLFSLAAIFLLFMRSYIQNKKASARQKLLNNSLNESNKKLSESNKQLEQLAHMTSHDLKAPLITITNFSALINKSAATKRKRKELF